MSKIMELADQYARALAEESHAIDFASTADYERRINERIEARAALASAVAEIERDAARYRQLRQTTHTEFQRMCRLANMSQAYGGRPLDESLDLAMKERT